MVQQFYRWILYRVLGWQTNVTEPHPGKYIICLAPHTSNWDFILGQLYARAEGMKTNFLMKKEWFFWPLGTVFRHLGGIPVWRSEHKSLTDVLAYEARKADTFCLAITPEGTRSYNPNWKLGFYFIALKAGLPVLLYGVDYKRRLIQCTKTVIPNGDVKSQMMEIEHYYKNFKGKHPERFTTGE